jgi:CRISPR-associated protein (TIGR02584 family)
MTDPAAYPRRILLAVTGLTPQIVTETLYALAAERRLWVPTEIRIITTRRGAEKAARTLLSDEGWFHRLRVEYRLPEIAFGIEDIHVIKGPDGPPLDDILEEADNAAVADFITEEVRALTADPNASLHVSIAGGRKTMGFYVGYALSLFGRAQDRLSHVLVPPTFESRPDFFYPPPAPPPIPSPHAGEGMGGGWRPTPGTPACIWATSRLLGFATGCPSACSKGARAFPKRSPKRRRRCRRQRSISTRRRER